MTTSVSRENWDVVVVGGGSGGLAASVCLARSRRHVLLVDEGKQRNLPAEGVHNFLTRENTSPAEIFRMGRDEFAKYGGEFVAARVTGVVADPDAHGIGFKITLNDGKKLRARRLVIATGLTDELPPLPGIKDRWGKDVLHCPYCHGWEVRDKAIGVLASNPLAVHQALLFNQLSPGRVKFFAHLEAKNIKAEELEKIKAVKVEIIEGEVSGLVLENDALRGVRVADGRVVALDALAVQTRMHANVDFAAGLGLKTTPHPVGDYVKVTAPSGRCEIPGVWVVGNAGDLMGQVMTSAANGLMAGADINYDLVTADVEAAVAQARAQNHSE